MTPLRIAELTLREIRLPLVERFVISSGWMDNRRILLLELRDEDGATTWSECVAGERPNYSPETIDTAWLAIREWLAPKLFEAEPAGPEAVAALLADGVQGHRMAKAALEMGCWGLAAERAGISLAELIGGTRERVATGISIGIQDTPSDLVERAVAALATGYRKVKLKISPGADIEYVAAVRDAIGADAALAVDANAAYTLDDADHLARLDAFDMIMIEQPLAAGDLVRHARLQERIETPICLDESIVDVASAEDMLALGAGRIVNIKPGRVGGFAESRAIHDTAQAAGIPVWCGGMLESGIGRAYNVALASLPNFELPGDLSPSARYWARDIVSPEWTMTGDGFVEVPRGRPGLGVEIDAERIESLTVRTEVLSGRPTPV
ncbi:MAG: o-succinylbenzoate synthase [Gemmatimonadota bacterium]|nr:o-succinylbenzoate synthase [Gemmatimonadota bacterium]